MARRTQAAMFTVIGNQVTPSFIVSRVYFGYVSMYVCICVYVCVYACVFSV